MQCCSDIHLSEIHFSEIAVEICAGNPIIRKGKVFESMMGGGGGGLGSVFESVLEGGDVFFHYKKKFCTKMLGGGDIGVFGAPHGSESDTLPDYGTVRLSGQKLSSGNLGG